LGGPGALGRASGVPLFALGLVVLAAVAGASLTGSNTSAAMPGDQTAGLDPTDASAPGASSAPPAVAAVTSATVALPVATASVATASAATAPPAAPSGNSPESAPTLAPSTKPAGPSVLPTTWTLDIYDRRSPRYQDPDLTACTAAATLSMLNTIAYNRAAAASAATAPPFAVVPATALPSAVTSAPPPFVWKPTTSFSAQESILRFERAHMTMRKSSNGSDPHGWRNALNYFGWGSIEAGVYRDAAYTTLISAERAVVMAVATYHKPVGVDSLDGKHAQYVTGYRVVGDDPRTGSTNFRILGVYVTDPWRLARYRDKYVTAEQWGWGFTWLRLAPYRQFDSPYRDPIDGHVGRTEWYGKWVIIEPVK
jgi:hypothetical protein